MNYYNEFDPKAAAWLRELIKMGEIPDGYVDERSITEVKAHELNGYTQHHFFGGIGGWSLALKLAGWPSDRPVWTSSCPCQPFSSAGKQQAQSDPRHLWPVFFRLVRECRPDTIFGEQVSSAIRHGWLDGVCADLEGEDYSVGAVVCGAHSLSAPHIRQRLYWVALANGRGLEERLQRNGRADESGFPASLWHNPDGCGEVGGLGLTQQPGLEGHSRHEHLGYKPGRVDPLAHGSVAAPGHWSKYDLIPCRDGKSRRIEPGTPALAPGLPRGVVPSCDLSESYVQATGEARVMRLKGYGNSIVAPLAAEFIRAVVTQ